MDKRHQRMGLVAGVLGNVVPIIVLGMHHRSSELHANPVVGIGTTLAILAPIGVNVLAGRLRVLTWLFAYSGIVGLTMMQADTGGVGSVYSILFMMPMIWFGLMASRFELLVVAMFVTACCLVPMQVFPQQYPHLVRPALALAIVALSVMLSLAGASNEVRRLTTRLRAAASHDQLTGLLNRRGWEETTERTLARVKAGSSWSVVLLDLDNLKVINDTMGHDQGDLVLNETGKRLREHLVGAAVVSRLGGDEFVALYIGTSADRVLFRLQELQQATPESGAFSAGVAAAVPGEDLRQVMRRADLALYEVKATGRGRSALASDPPFTGSAQLRV